MPYFFTIFCKRMEVKIKLWYTMSYELRSSFWMKWFIGRDKNWELIIKNYLFEIDQI